MSHFGVFLVTTFCFWTLSQASRVTYSGHVPETKAASDDLPVEVVQRLEKVRKLGIDWLLSQATDDYGWQSDDTARVVVALASSVEDWPAQNDLVARLIVKQLEIELLEKILRREIESLTPAKIALFALSLGASCRDPHDFYGHNLIASLDKHHNDQDFPGLPETFGYSFTSLVTCLAGSHLNNKRKAKHLLQISNEYIQKGSKPPLHTDTRGIALMALECIRHRKKGEILAHHMHDPLEIIALQQEGDGSFGNIHTTAIAVQTLAASGDSILSWNKTSAALALEKSQELNGSWDPSSKTKGPRHGSTTSTIVVATAESVVAISALLNGHGVLGLTRSRCNSIRKRRKYKASTSFGSINSYSTHESIHQQIVDEMSKAKLIAPGYVATPEKSSISQASNTTNFNSDISTLIPLTSMKTDATITPDVSSDLLEQINLVPIKYWLWIGPHPITAIKHNLTLHVPANTTFYFVMQRAAELVSEYEFSSKIWPTGHYIDSIAAQFEPPTGPNYWVLYILGTDPDPQNPPENNLVAPAGVDDLRIETNQVYLFWYKAL